MGLNDHVARTEKQFVEIANDMMDSEAKEIFSIVVAARNKYAGLYATPRNLEAMRDEILHRMAERNFVAEIDISPCYRGEPPVVEVVGRIRGDAYHKYGTDYEKKVYEVKKAKGRGEDYLGQKEATDSTPAKKRAKNSK